MEFTNKKGIDMLISFDTTGSMYPVLSRVRREIKDFVTNMFKEIGDLRIAIIAHGDYCDKDDPYTIRVMPFTTDVDGICKFVNETEGTCGGDADECYELVLATANSTLDWKSDREKFFILIGDANPHGINYPDNTRKLYWREEANKLGNMGIKIFPVHALSYYRSSSYRFYNDLATITNGTYLTLDQFDEITTLIKATCFAEFSKEKLTEYVEIIRANKKMTRTMAQNLGRLQGDKNKYIAELDKAAVDGLMAVPPGRFQAMHVDGDCAIKEFVLGNGIAFKKGRGFYELTKRETIQQYKEIILQNRETGEMFTGTQVREYLHLSPQIRVGGVHEKLYAKDAKEFRIFVQSTSVNRKLIGGTTFLYEVEDFKDTPVPIPVPVAPSKEDIEADEKLGPIPVLPPEEEKLPDPIVKPIKFEEEPKKTGYPIITDELINKISESIKELVNKEREKAAEKDNDKLFDALGEIYRICKETAVKRMNEAEARGDYETAFMMTKIYKIFDIKE